MESFKFYWVPKLTYVSMYDMIQSLLLHNHHCLLTYGFAHFSNVQFERTRAQSQVFIGPPRLQVYHNADNWRKPISLTCHSLATITTFCRVTVRMSGQRNNWMVHFMLLGVCVHSRK